RSPEPRCWCRGIVVQPSTARAAMRKKVGASNRSGGSRTRHTAPANLKPHFRMAAHDFVPRTLASTVRRISKGFPVLLLTGPRQSGKTTLLQHLAARDRSYVTLDDPAVRGLAREDPRLFLQRHPPPILIDEIQY